MKKSVWNKLNGNSSRRLLDRSVLLDETEGPPLVQSALLFGAFIVVAFVVWASFSGLEEIESASGEIIPANDPIRLQYPSLGVIVDLPVREGALVETGQILVRMDPAENESSRIQARFQLLSLYAQRERLSAAIAGRNPDFSELPEDAGVFIQDQKALHRTTRTQLALTIGIVESQIAQTRLDTERIVARRQAVARQAAIAKEDAALTQNLVERGAAARPELLGKLRIVESLAEESASLDAEAAKVSERASELTIKLNEIQASAVKQMWIDLSGVNERISQAEAHARRLENSAGRLELVAPCDARVQVLNYRSVGSVVPSGATIMELIPIGEISRAQIRIKPQSIGSLKVGIPARVKVSAYPYDRYGAFVGTLTDFSATTFSANDGSTYYRGTIEIFGRELAGSSKLDLVPGMTLSADLRVGEKTLMQYLLKPVFASAREAFREK